MGTRKENSARKTKNKPRLKPKAKSENLHYPDIKNLKEKIYSSEFINILGELVRECGGYLRHIRANADLKRGKTDFNHINLKDLEIGEQATIFIFKWKNKNHEFWVKTKEDGSSLTSADVYIHNILKNFFLENLPEVPFISEENPKKFNQAQANGAKALRKKGIILPYAFLDSLDNTRGFWDLIMGDKHPSNQQCSINLSISFPYWNRGVAFVDLPFQNQHFYTDGKNSFVINNTHLLNSKPILLRAPHGKNRIENISAVSGYHGNGKMADFLNRRNIKDYILNQAVGANRVFALYNHPTANLTRTGGGCYMWDFMPLWEIFCQHFAIGIEKDKINGDDLGRLALSFDKPELPVCAHFIGNPDLLKYLGLTVIDRNQYEELSIRPRV